MKSESLGTVGHGLAGLSHDLKNVLAILAESVGLVGDLVSTEADDRIDRAFERIVRQLERADGMASRLSRFAHTFDDPGASQSLSHVVDQALFLVDRRARTRAVDVQAVLDSDFTIPLAVGTLLRLATLLESAVDTLPTGSTVRVTSDGTWILVTGEPEGKTVPASSAEFLADAEGAFRPVDFSCGRIVAIRLS